jgi:uncharacterized protein YfdQ (DUF2303 family)
MEHTECSSDMTRIDDNIGEQQEKMQEKKEIRCAHHDGFRERRVIMQLSDLIHSRVQTSGY